MCVLITHIFNGEERRLNEKRFIYKGEDFNSNVFHEWIRMNKIAKRKTDHQPP